MKLREGFSQKRGFVTTERPILHTSAEVVFPKSNLLADMKSLDTVVKKIRPDFIRTFFLEKDVLTEHNLQRLELDFGNDYDKDRVTELLTKNDIFEKYLNFLQIEQDVYINILPVNFGTSFTYTYEVTDRGVEFFTTYRYDLQPNFFISGLIGASVLYKIEENKQQLDESKRGNIPWISRQFLVDFLSSKTSLSKLVGEAKDKGTLLSLRDVQQFGQIFLDSKSYLESLKLAYPVDMKFGGNRLFIDDISIDLTIAEMKIVSYLNANRNVVCSFDSLAEAIWEGDDEKYSMYALSKHLANIRKKVSEAGFTHTLIQVARKQGVVLNL